MENLTSTEKKNLAAPYAEGNRQKTFTEVGAEQAADASQWANQILGERQDKDDISESFMLHKEQEERESASQWANQILGEGSQDLFQTHPPEQQTSNLPENEGDDFTFSDALHNVSEVPRGVLTGAIAGLNESVQTLYDLADKVPVPDWGVALDFRDGEGGYTFPPEVKLGDLGEMGAEPPQLPSPDAPETGLGKVTKSITQFLSGFLAGGRILRGVKAVSKSAQVGKAMAQGAVADFAFMDEAEGRLSNLIQEVPALQNPVTEYLAASPGDGKIESRFKNSLEGMGLGIAAEGLFQAVKTIRNYKIAKSSGMSNEEILATVKKEGLTGEIKEESLFSGLENLGDPEAPLVSRAPVIEPLPTEISAKELAGNQPTEQVYINWSRIDTPDDIKQVLQNSADIFKHDIDEARRGVKTFEEIKLSAEQENAWQILLDRRQGQPLNAEQSLAVRNLWSSSSQKLSETARLAASNPNPQNIAAFRKMLGIQYAVQKEAIAARTETARALSSWRIQAGPDEHMVSQMEGLIEHTGGLEVNRELAQKISALSETGMAVELDKFVELGLWARTRASIQEAWIMGLLSNVKTHAVNISSNLMVAAQQVFERGVAARVGRALGETDGVQLGEAMAMLQGYASSFGEGLSLAGKAFKLNQGSMRAGKIELPPTPAISAETWKLTKDSTLGKFVDLLGEGIRLPGRALVAEDEFFKAIGYKAELYAQAFRQASREAQSGTISNSEIKMRMAEIIADPPKNIQLSAIDNAAYSTFTNAPGDFTRAWMNATNKIPALRFITPFIRTPSNIMSYAISERSPLAPLFRSFREDVVAGGARRQLALTKMSTGSIIMLGAMDLAFGGYITGEGPASPAERQTLMRTGWQPNSLKIGDQYFSYSRLDPVGMTLGIAGNLVEIANHVEQDDAEVDIDEAVLYYLGAIANSVMSKSYLQGLSGFVEAISNPSASITHWGRRMAASFIPAISGEITRQTDPYMLETNSMIDAMRAKIPGLSKDLPARRDLWGRPISYRSGLGTFYDALSPIASRRENPLPIDQEMLRLELYIATPKKQVSFDGINIDLTNHPGAYARFTSLAGNDAKDLAYNLGCMDYLNAVVEGKHPNSIDYQMRTDGPDGGKAEFIRGSIQKYRDQAKKIVLDEFPEIRAQVERKVRTNNPRYNFMQGIQQ